MSGNANDGNNRKITKNIDAAVTWYTKNLEIYESLATKVAEIVNEVLDAQGIEYHTVIYRAKKIDRFREKAMKDKYIDPIKEIKDLAGIRVTTYVESEAKKVADIIEKLFKIVPEHSIDKSKVLGINQVGYRSIHYVARFSSERCRLLEFKRFSGLEFEIQIRTLLQDVWAEIEHDKSYKFSGILPVDIQRRFYILAGALELADREFDQLSLDIDLYKDEIAEKTKQGNLDIEINTTALREFLSKKFLHSISEGILNPYFGSTDAGATKIVEELKDFGIKTLGDLDKIIPEDLDDKLAGIEKYRLFGIENFIGLVRGLMMVEDAERYFEKAWSNNWRGLPESPIDKIIGLDVDEITRKYEVEKIEL